MTTPDLDIPALVETYGAEAVKELLEMSLDECSHLLKDLQSDIEAEQGKRTKDDAHQLKGLAATMTMSGIAELALALENCAKEGRWQDAGNTFAEIRELYDSVQLKIKAFLNSSV